MQADSSSRVRGTRQIDGRWPASERAAAKAAAAASVAGKMIFFSIISLGADGDDLRSEIKRRNLSCASFFTVPFPHYCCSCSCCPAPAPASGATASPPRLEVEGPKSKEEEREGKRDDISFHSIPTEIKDSFPCLRACVPVCCTTCRDPSLFRPCFSHHG